MDITEFVSTYNRYQADKGRRAQYLPGSPAKTRQEWAPFRKSHPTGPEDRIHNVSSDEFLAIDYTAAFLDSGMPQTVKESLGQPALFDISFVSNDADLSSLTKRAHLVANELIMAQESTESEMIGKLQDFRISGLAEVKNVRLNGTTAARLGAYLRSCRPLIESGRMLYFPRVSIDSYTSDNDPGADLGVFSRDEDISILQLFDMVISGRTIIRTRIESQLARRLLEPLLTVELPYLENTTLYDFCRIAVDESEALDAARAYFRTQALGVGMVDGHPDSAEVAKLSIAVHDSIRAIESELKRVRRKTAVQSSGAAIATISATLVAIYGKDLSTYLSILGASGGAWGAIQATDSYVESKAMIKDRPLYLMWLLSKQPKKA